jgi:hypothetical protein
MLTLVVLVTLVIAGRVAYVQTRPPAWHQDRAKRKALRLERQAWEARVRRSERRYPGNFVTAHHTIGLAFWGGDGGVGGDCGSGGADGGC